MPDALSPLFAAPQPASDRPLAGVTVLLVEDSRFASEAVRLLCLRSGARIRRADSLRSAERHLATYRPTVVVVDLGLPDGSGLGLIARLAAAQPRLPAILATSGDEGAREAALAAGADAFLPKPCTGLAAFQRAVLGALRLDGAAAAAAADEVAPDRLAYRDDLAGARQMLADPAGPAAMAYAARFLAGVARSADDPPLAEAAADLSAQIGAGAPAGAILARVAGLLEQRLAAGEGLAARRAG
jgi:CheY-like chemotaxis protein